MYSFQNADWMSFSVEILEHFQTAGYLVFYKYFPAARYLDTVKT